jgi:UDP-glucose 4-epimerase
VSGTFNIGTGVETSVVALFEAMRGVAGVDAIAEHGPARAGEQRRSALAAALATRRLGWHPRVDLAEGLRRTVESFRRQLA